MNRFFELFGGPVAVLLSIVATIFISNRWRIYRNAETRRFLVALFYWGPLFLLACMLLHNIQNAYRAAVSIRDYGVFNFYFYSLQLFGFVVGYQSYLLLRSCRHHVSGRKRVNRKVLGLSALIVLTTLPTFVFTPIGIIPPAVLILTVLMSFFIHKPSTSYTTQKQVKEAALEVV